MKSQNVLRGIFEENNENNLASLNQKSSNLLQQPQKAGAPLKSNRKALSSLSTSQINSRSNKVDPSSNVVNIGFKNASKISSDENVHRKLSEKEKVLI
jgi:hypothetical protein